MATGHVLRKAGTQIPLVRHEHTSALMQTHTLKQTQRGGTGDGGWGGVIVVIM